MQFLMWTCMKNLVNGDIFGIQCAQNLANIDGHENVHIRHILFRSYSGVIRRPCQLDMAGSGVELKNLWMFIDLIRQIKSTATYLVEARKYMDEK